MKYIITQIQSSQYILKPGDTITINGTHGQAGDKLSIGRTLLINNQKDGIDIGTPYLNQVPEFEVISHQKSSKIRVSKFKAKSRYRRVKGHRQDQTTIKFLSIKDNKSNSTSKKTPKKPPTKDTKTQSTAKTKPPKKTSSAK